MRAPRSGVSRLGSFAFAGGIAAARFGGEDPPDSEPIFLPDRPFGPPKSGSDRIRREVDKLRVDKPERLKAPGMPPVRNGRKTPKTAPGRPPRRSIRHGRRRDA